ncbi:MAG: DUF4349 domain-containing protein [Planctomycetes bacterium]|nr:DUF4349 domain-containing protein [Planctomycetota bacterium]
MDSGAYRLSKDEQAVLDHVSGLTRVLAEPADPICEDREFVGELVAMRSKLGAMAIHPPKMRLTFDDVLAAADLEDRPPTDNRIIYWLTGRWGIGLVTAASVALAFITGVVATGGRGIIFSSVKQAEQFPVHSDSEQGPSAKLRQPDALAPGDRPSQRANITVDEVTTGTWISDTSEAADTPVDPALYGSIVREGSIHLRDADPAKVQRLVTELVTSSAGVVTGLTRQGTGEDVGVSISVAVPADKYREFKAKVAGFGEVLGESESTEDVTSDQVDLKSRLSEAEDYLTRLDKLIETPTDLSSLQNLERERRQTRLEIERYKRAIAALENRVALSRLDVLITTTEPEAPPEVEKRGELVEAWDDGVEGLKAVSGTLLRIGVAGSPFLALGAIAYLVLRRKRKKLEAQDRIAA